MGRAANERAEQKPRYQGRREGGSQRIPCRPGLDKQAQAEAEEIIGILLL